MTNVRKFFNFLTFNLHFAYPQSYKRLWFFQFSTYIFSADITPEMLKLGRVTKVKWSFQWWYTFLILANSNLFEFSTAILEKGLFQTTELNCNKPWCVVKQNTWLALAKQPGADHCNECHHRRHFLFTENRVLKVVITANRLVFWNRNTASLNKNYRKTAPEITQNHIIANPYAPFFPEKNRMI